MLLSAFILGLLSSLHCVGMCGPIALAMGGGKQSFRSLLTGRLSYNLGRITTYMMLGGILGLVGQGISFAGLQQGLSIGLGIVLLGMILFSSNWESNLRIIPSGWLFRLKQQMGSLLNRPTPAARYNVGILNGFLPCGFVYLALAGAVTEGGILPAITYMMFFGLGTLPAMLGISVLGGLLPASINLRLRPLLRGAAIVFAFLLILRGLNLGIPYVSPILPDTTAGVVECNA